VGRKIRRKE